MEARIEFSKILPDDDSTFVEYQKFKKQFGEDGSTMVMGFADKNLFELEKFNDWYELNLNLKKMRRIHDIFYRCQLFTSCNATTVLKSLIFFPCLMLRHAIRRTWIVLNRLFLICLFTKALYTTAKRAPTWWPLLFTKGPGFQTPH